MADATVIVKAEEKALNIPPEVAEKFGELVELIKGSKSMNFDERQYWVDVLPIMSEEQISNLRGILDNEKKQLEAAAQAYSEGTAKKNEPARPAFDEKAYQEKKRQLSAQEAEHEAEESLSEEDVLAELNNL